MPKLKKEIIETFHKKMGWKIQTIRDNISRFKINECPNSTQNAAAHILALTKGFSCAKKLYKIDKQSLPSNLSDILEKYKPNRKKYNKVKNHDNKIKKKMRSTNELERDASKNASVYPQIFILENMIRKLILQQMGNDTSWWKKPYVTTPIMEYAQRIKDDEKETPWIKSKGDHPLYYITLKHLCKIIQINWPSKFNMLGRQDTFLARFEDVYPIRNGLAHHIPLTIRDKKEIDIISDKICKLLKAKYGI